MPSADNEFKGHESDGFRKYQFQRLGQALVLMLHTWSVMIAWAIFASLWFLPQGPLLALLYLLHIFLSSAGTSGRLDRRSNRLRCSWFSKAFTSYFPCELHRSAPLPNSRKYVLGYHPHGIICHGAFASFATDVTGFSTLFPGITNVLLTLDSNFKIPIYREYILSMGLGGVSRSSCHEILSQGGSDGRGAGRAITIAVGGARESLLAKPGSMKLFIRGRIGFIRIAIRQGADVVPVLGFGENQLYDRIDSDMPPFVLKLQMLLKDYLGWTLPLFYGRSFFGGGWGFMPHREPLHVVVGRPVEVTQQDNPDASYIEQIHQAYVNEIWRTWNEWKHKLPLNSVSELELL
ncbi:diacylglycerol o-acyltransferase [Penicillium cinerascens]|uniref:Diacylglycerol O-acyltransferase n=1 Tax=Penicillium cinerascens TaxID=70096 RepID=A0A9W9MCS8_9EURO|nr:diacylglycerol o-acyltransferase [Penicillium cinerascens]KAJ5197725.1 diacylglycerol o-acyltransferase [Penicillium cinerascens]